MSENSTVVKEINAKFTADLSDFRKKVQEAGKVGQDLQDRINDIGEAAAATQNITAAQMQKISRSLASAGKQAAALGKQAQSLVADESQLTRAIADQEASMSRIEEEYSSLQAESERLSSVYDTVKDAISGLNLSGTLTSELNKTKESLTRHYDQIEELQAKIANAQASGDAPLLEALQRQLQRLTTETDQVRERYSQLTGAMQQIGKVNIGYASAAGLKQLQTELGNTNGKMGQLTLQAGQTASRMLTYQERLDQTKAKQREVNTSAYELAYGLQDLETEVASASTEMSNTTAPTTLSQRLGNLSDRLNEVANGFSAKLDSSLQGLSSSCTSASGAVSALGNVAGSALGVLGAGLGTTVTGLASKLAALGESALSAAKNGLSKLGSKLSSLGGKVGSAALSGLKSIAAKITGIGSSARSTASGGLSGMVRQIRNISAVSLGLKVCSSLFGQLKTVVNNCVSSNEGLSNQVEVLQNSLSNALAPAISLIVNLLSKIMPYIVGIADAVASLITNLFGVGWTSVSTGASSAADAVGDVADATNDAADAQAAYNRQVMGFDEITKLDDSSSSSGTGSSGSGSGATTSTTDSTGGILGILPDWLNNIASLIESSSWAELGTYLADCLGGAVDKLYDILTSAATYAKIDSAVNALTTTVNSFFKEMNLVDDATGDSIASKTGKAIGAAINLAFYTVNSVVTGIDWGEIGKTIANVINGAVEETNWSQIGETIANVFLVLPKTIYSVIINTDWGAVTSGLSEMLISACDSISSWLDEVDWSAVADSIKDALGGIDWAGIATSVFTMIGKAIGGIADILYELVVEPIVSWVTDWANWGKEMDLYGDDVGLNILYGILNGIVTGIANIGTWIYDNILTPFIDGFKSTFGIHSPATNDELLEAAGYVGEGILNGIASVFTSIGKWVENNILAPISNALSSAGDFVLNVGVALADTAQSVWNSFKTAWNKLTGVAVSIANSLASAASSLWSGFKTAWNKLSGVAVSIGNSLANAASSVWNSFKSAWGKLTGVAVSIGNSLKSTASSLWSSFKSGWGKLSSTTVSITNSLKNTAADLWEKFKSGWKNKTLGISITYDTNVGAVKKAVYKALGLKGWPTIKFAAKGGIVDRATLLGSTVAGEDGQEAIIPLERNTEWADIVATQIAGKLAGGLSRALDSFGEMVTAGFAAMLEGLNSLMEQAAAMVPDLSDVQVPEIASRSEALHSTAQSYLPDRGADESWVDAVADRVAQRVSARSGSQSGGDQTITVQCVLDGKIVAQNTVRYINGEARRTGVNPLASYL